MKGEGLGEKLCVKGKLFFQNQPNRMDDAQTEWMMHDKMDNARTEWMMHEQNG